MATTIIPSPHPLSTISNSRQNLVNQSSAASFTSATTAFEVQNPNMSFSMSQGSQGGGAMMMQGGNGPFRQFDGGHNGHQRRNSAPQIYSAVYSGVDVYEMEVNGIAVMRRRKDSWLNATQILKVAGIEKGKRTKVLEKEILIGEHEKVQGGYGKYQGTWIKFDRGLEFCRQYGVEELLRPLLTYDMGHDGGVPGRGGIDTPTKEQAMAAQRKRLYNSSAENRGMNQGGTFFKNISSTASHAVAAISKARFDSPVPRIRNGTSSSRPASFSRQSSSQQLVGSQESAYPTNSQQSAVSYASEPYQNGLPDSAYSTQIDQRNGDFEEPPRKRIRQTPNEDLGMNEGYYDLSMREPSPTEPNESFMYQNPPIIGEITGPLNPLPTPSTPQGQSKVAYLMTLFVNPSREDFRTHEVFTQLKAEDLDLPIDGSGNTAVIWAATLCRLPLLRQLVAKGASISRVNNLGETALMRACLVTNNADHQTFIDLLELLHPTIDFTDSRGRTVIHHIALSCAIKGRSQAAKYYIESLLEFLVRKGVTDRQQSFGGGYKSVDIGRFMAEIVNIQDQNGDTGLMIASRIGNRNIINQLKEVGGDPSIANKSGLTPQDFGVGGPPNPSARIEENRSKTLSGDGKQNSDDIVTAIISTLQEVQAENANEIAARQTSIDRIHQQLRETSRQLGEQRRKYEYELAQAKIRDIRKMKIANLAPAIVEERERLRLLQSQYGQPPSSVVLKEGDADEGLSISPTSQAGQILTSIDLSTQALDSQSQAVLAVALPPVHVLRARLNGYKSNNAALEEGVRQLQSKSSELAQKYRTIISLCTHTDESRVDTVLENLLRAVESEKEVDLGRVREFLLRVGED